MSDAPILLQVRDLLKVEWVQGDPARGLDYVYLSEDDFQKVSSSVKATVSVLPSGELAVLGALGVPVQTSPAVSCAVLFEHTSW